MGAREQFRLRGAAGDRVAILNVLAPRSVRLALPGADAAFSARQWLHASRLYDHSGTAKNATVPTSELLLRVSVPPW